MKRIGPIFVLAFVAATLAGCSKNAPPPTAASGKDIVGSPETAAAPDPTAKEIAEERAKLSPEDRALVNAQEWCVISDDERLGSMGAPIKLTIQGKPVFICCSGCKKKAEANPEKTLAKLTELKAKKVASGEKN